MDYSYFRLLKRVLWECVQFDRLTYPLIFINHAVFYENHENKDGHQIIYGLE